MEGGGESGKILWVNAECGESGSTIGGVGERGGDGDREGRGGEGAEVETGTITLMLL